MSEDITTIFVVGFPDDMKEREFQNMFTFSPGFEAATLKIPSGEDALDKDAQKKQIIGFAKFHTRLEALEARDILTGRKVDAEKNCMLKAEMAKKNLHTRRGLSSLGLSTAVAATFGLDTPSTALGFQQQQQQQQSHQQQQQQQAAPQQNVPRTASLTGSMLSSATRPEHLRISATRAFNPFNDIPLASAPILGASAHRSFSSSQFSSAFSSNVEAQAAPAVSQMPGTAGVMGAFMYGDQSGSNLTTTGPHASASGMMMNRRGSVHGSTPVSSSLALSAAAGAPINGIHQQQQQQQDTSEHGSTDGDALQIINQKQQQQSSSPKMQAQQPRDGQSQMPQQPPKGFSGQRLAVLDIAALQPRINQLNLGQMSANSMISPMGVPYSASVTTPVGMVLPMATTRSVNSNDQNPPCNTLYVGNLPVGAKEDELRQIFQSALGFRRMSYKAKPNSGPMCFVEFESIDFATLAMGDLDGRMLSNSVGGGIRLSYSKNPLGVRSQNTPSSAGAAGGMPPITPVLNSAAAAAAAAAAASVAASANGFQISGPPYGYSVAAMQQQQQQQQSYGRHHQYDSTSSPPSSVLLSRTNTNLAPSSQQQQQQQHHQAAVGNHRHSMSSSSAASPLPSPGTAKSGDQTAVPKDALSFLHQPIHQLHKQASADHPISSTGSTTPPQTTTSSANHIANIALDQ
ncbi:hypothetical protein LPJ53_003447 [Coemansia erecta]|uniref:RRM domain-containing protein n=1 Tax=Coemansia erecta TaxID=147472 RepID=A0A9W7Y226_9FUNG|nr:hypothetical protein LPJ53_003447 [Coemansia erecta]